MKSLFSVILSIAVLFGMLSSVEAQQQIQVADNGVKVEIEFDTQKTPDYQAGNVKGKKVPNPREWLEVEVEFKVKAAPSDAVIPKLMFKYYVAIKSKEGNAQMVTGEFTHVNVLAGEENFSSAYVSPATLGRITGDFRRFQSSSIMAVAVAVYYNGVLKGGASEGSLRGKWWEGQSGTQDVLSKAETPFKLLWIDRYADIEKSKN